MPSWKKVVLHGQDATLGDLTLTNITSSAVLGTDADGNVIAGTVTGTPIATTSTVGTVKIGDGLSIDANGELSIGTLALTDINAGTTAGFLKTDNSGSISVDTTAYLPKTSANALTLVSTMQVSQGTTANLFSIVYSGTNVFSVDSAGYVNSYSGFKTGGTTGFLRSDGTVDTSTYLTSTDISSFIEIGDVETYLSTNDYITSAAVGTVAPTNYPASPGTTKYLREDGTFQIPPDTKYSDFTGATDANAGRAGLVPAPSAKDQNEKFLKADGTWQVPKYIANTDTNYYLSGASFASGSGDLTLTVSGTTNQTVNLDGRYLTSLPSHNHDSRYYTETEVDTFLAAKASSSHNHDTRYTRVDGGANDFRFELNLGGSIGTRYYKVATVNRGSGGLHIRGLISNHVESFASQKVDIAIQGRESNDATAIEVNGTVSVFHEGCGILVVPGAKPGSYLNYDVYVVSTNYTQCELDLTGVNVAFNTDGSFVADTPVGTAEIDTTALTEGHYVITDSIATILGSAAFADTSAFDPAGAADAVDGKLSTLESSLGTAAAASTTDFAAANHNHDDRYYTESEMDTKLANKLSLSGGTLTGTTAGEDVFAVDGVNGRLFSVTDDLSDSLFSVNTIAGLPVIEVFADNTVKIGPYTNPVTIESNGALSVGGGTNLGTALVGATVSNDTITFTRANGATFNVTTSDANTNYYLNGITKSGNTLTFAVNGTTDQTYEFGSAAFAATTDFAAASHTHPYLPLTGGTLARTTNTTLDTGTTLLTLENNVGSDISQQQTFVDFVFTDGNVNFTPQVRIGAQAGRNADANAISKEGAGAFFVATGDGTDEAGGGTLTERFRVDYQGTVRMSAYGAGILQTDAKGYISVDTNTYAISTHSHSAATTSAAGFMSSIDKTKLDGIAEGADVTPSWVPATDPSYLTSLPSHNHDSSYLALSGGTLTGGLTVPTLLRGQYNNGVGYPNLRGFAAANNPENGEGMFYYVGYSNNRLAGANRRYTVTALKNGNPFTLSDAVFRSTDNYQNISVNREDVIEIVIGGVSFHHSSAYGVAFSTDGWRARDVVIQVSTDGGTTWLDVTNAKDYPYNVLMARKSTGSTRTDTIKFTLTNFATSSCRLSSLFANNYSGGDAYFLDKWGDDTFNGSLTIQDNATVNGSVYIGTTEIINSSGQWVGDPTGLTGPKGDPGAPGADGANGASAYEVALAQGFVGTEAEWLASLQGADGNDGAPGTPGADGADGVAPARILPEGINTTVSRIDFDQETGRITFVLANGASFNSPIV